MGTYFIGGQPCRLIAPSCVFCLSFSTEGNREVIFALTWFVLEGVNLTGHNCRLVGPLAREGTPLLYLRSIVFPLLYFYPYMYNNAERLLSLITPLLVQ